MPCYKYRLFNVLCWLWNIYEGAELPSVYFITNTKHCITYLALTQLFPVLISHPEMYTLCSFLLHCVYGSHFIFRQECVHMGQMDFISSIFVRFFFKIIWEVLFVCFYCFTSQVNSYGHCGTVSSPNHTFSWAGLNKRLTSNSCTYFRL